MVQDVARLGDGTAVRRNDNVYTTTDGSTYRSTFLTAFVSVGEPALLLSLLAYDVEPDVAAFMAIVSEANEYAAAVLD